jgi:RHS repeat-associated protein
VTGTMQLIWRPGDAQPCEELDANNNVTNRFYPQGEQISGVSYFYTRDHLASVRELVDSTGAVRARYDYDPYGVRTKLSGDLEAQFGYTGHYYHQPSGLNLALYRAYDAGVGRWLSRDPLKDAEMTQGPNPYAYVQNKPINAIDRDGRHLNEANPDYLDATGESYKEANQHIAQSNQLLNDWLKNYLDAFFGVANRSWKAAREGGYYVDVAWEDFLKWLKKQLEDETKKKCSDHAG